MAHKRKFHQACSEELQDQIRSFINSMTGSVDNIYFQQYVDSSRTKENGNHENKDDPDCLKHRFLMSFVVPCRKMNDRLSHASKVETKERQDGSLHDEASTNMINSSAEAMLRMLQQQNRDAVFEATMKACRPETRYEREFGQGSPAFDSTNGGDFTAGFFPLSNEELHATIDEQLNKSPMPKTDWRSSLFNDVAPTPPRVERKPEAFQKNLNQSETCEVSSSSGLPQEYSVQIIKTEPLVTPNFAISTATPIALQAAGVNYAFNPVTALQELHPTPAELPSVSEMLSSGSQFDWPFQFVPATKGLAASVVRSARRHLPLRPTLILPKGFQRDVANKPSSSTANCAVVLGKRSRKKSPLKTTKELEEEPQSQVSDTSSNAPRGHSYESWILEEGLYKIRKQGLHKTDDKDACPYACPACDKRYKNPNGIKYHARYAHGPRSAYSCEICQREYSTQHGLSAHRRAHFSPEPFSIKDSYNCTGMNNNGPTTTVVITSVPT